MNNSALFKLNSVALEKFSPGFTDNTTYFNLFGDYTYLTEGYYKSLDAELLGITIHPTSEEALDAYVVPLAMQKALAHQIPIPPYEIATDRVTPPVLAYPINPFSTKYQVITSRDDMETKLRALTMTGKYATICQSLPDDYRIDTVRCVLGMTLVPEYESFAKQIFEVFKIPLMRTRVIVTSADYLLSAIEPLQISELTLREKKIVGEMGTWQE